MSIPPEQLAKDLQDMEDEAAALLAAEYLKSIQKTRKGTDWPDIERRLATRQEAGDVAGAIDWQDYAPLGLLEPLFTKASGLRSEQISALLDIDFKLTDPNAIKWLQQYSADEVKYLSESQRQAVKDIVTRGYSEGITYQQQAREIRQIIGLDPRAAEAVANLRQRLLERGLISEAEIERRVARYAEKLLNARARTIAIQEALTAGARGFYETTADAVRRGILDPNIYEGYRIVTGDERLCPRCSAYAGEARKLPGGVYSSNGDVTPKLHLKCRCVEGIREIAMKKKEMKESGRGRADVIFEARGLKRKDGIIYCPTVPLVEGVYDGWGMPVLRQYDEFSKDAKWLNGLTVLTNHEALTPDARRVGQLSDITTRPEGKKVTATTQFYELDLTQREVDSILSQEPIHGSLGFSCYLDMTAGDYNGQHYDAIERGPYVFYEYSMVRQGVVTPEDGAGFNMECKGCKNPTHNHQSAPGGADMEMEQVQQMIEEAQKPLMDRIATLEAEKDALKGEQTKISEGIEADRKARVFEAFQAKLKPGHQEKAAEFYEAYQKDPAGWTVENADKFVQNGQVRGLSGSALTNSTAPESDLESVQAKHQKEMKKIWEGE